MGQRQQLLGLCGLLVLQFQLYHIPDKKLLKQVWDLHKKLPAVHVIGNLVWFHTDFLLTHIPYMNQRVVDKKQMTLVGTVREQYLTERSQNITR